MNLINRKELWFALIAFVVYLIAVKLTTLESNSLSTGIVIAGLAEFLRAASCFLGGYTLAVFATPRIRVHELPNDRPELRIMAYSYRLIVGIAFLAFAFSA